MWENLKLMLSRLLFRGKQAWLTDQIPKGYVDVDYLIELVLYQSLIEYWENGDGGARALSILFEASSESDPDYPEKYKCFLAMTDAYEWATKGRAVAVKNLEELRAAMLRPRTSGRIDQELAAAEEIFRLTDDEHLQNIVIHRRHLW